MGPSAFRIANERQEVAETMATGMAGIEALKGLSAGLKTRMEKAVEDFRNNLVSVRTGRASVHMLDSIRVEQYGAEVPLSQVATLKTPEAQLITVEPWDKSIVGAIEKAIRASNQGFNPNHDGKVIRVPIPPMTEERRKETVKHLSTVLEEHRTSIRNIRRDGNDTVKKATKDKQISADDEKRANDEIQQMTDAAIKRVEEMFKTKEKEVMTV